MAETAALDAWQNPLADATFKTLTNFPGTESDAAISPDGRFVAFLADRDGKFEVFLTQSETGTPTPLTKGNGDGGPWGGWPAGRTLTFKADGSELALSTSSRTPSRLVPLIGGAPRPFLGKGDSQLSWSRDGSRVVYMTMPTAIRSRSRTAMVRIRLGSTKVNRGSTIMRQSGLPMDSGSTSSTASRTPTA